MAEQPADASPGLEVTATAARHMRSFLQKEGVPNALLRVRATRDADGRVAYALAVEERSGSADIRFKSRGVEVVVDAASLPLVRGARIDYRETARGAGYVINNPNVTCGCGPGCSCRT